MKKILWIVLTVLISGCSSKTVTVSTNADIYKPLKEEKVFIKEIIPNVPPDRKEFKKADKSAKIKMLAEYTKLLLINMREYNEYIRELNKK